MKKKNCLKILLAGIMLGATIGVPVLSSHTFTYADTGNYINKLGASYEVTISNLNLRNKLCELLGKKSNSKLYSSDFADNENYRATKVTEEESETETWVAKTTWLDLSGIDVQDFRELVQFELPVTLQAIDLSNNNITASDIANLSTLLNFNTSSKNTTINEKNYIIRSNFDTLIKKVNLNLNKIELGSLSDANINDERMLYGIQNVSDSTLLTKEDLSNTKYYIRENDDIYMSYNFYFNDTRFNYTKNQITNLSEREYGSYKINISSPPLSESAYFYGYTDTIEYTMFDLAIKPEYTIERTHIFNLTKSDLNLQGIGLNQCDIEIFNAPTSEAGVSYAPLTITYKGVTKNLSLPFVVVDTIKPIIKLKGYDTMYWRQNRDWVDPGYIGTDSGEDISQLVEVDDHSLNVTQIGTYTITYNLTDRSGLKATTVTRTVIVQEQVLDEITIATAKKEYAVGEEIILTVTPNENTSMEKYTDFEYSWYLDGRLFKTTKGDSVTGKSTTSIILDNSNERIITVKLKAKQVADGRYVYVDSSDFTIKPSIKVTSDTSIIIASAVAVIIILAIIVTIYAVKAKKSTSKVSKKYKNTTRLQSEQSGTEIKIIKDYNNTTNNTNGGGKENEHSPAEKNDNNQEK